MSWTPYRGDAYLDWPAVDAWCASLAEAHPRWVRRTTVGTSRRGRSIPLLTLGDHDGDPASRPAFWMDGGTHASEWTGVMCTLFAVSAWVERAQTDEAFRAWLATHTVYVLPCVSPDGFQAMHEGSPLIRSSLRPPRPGMPRQGLSPEDVDGDGVVRWMRWKHPAGGMVADPRSPVGMRRRRLDDDPGDAYFLCSEGRLVNWDGVAWVEAPLEFGVDLNRNFPSDWKPFSMFGMDSGAFPASEPESRALVEAFAARPYVGAALTCHTYTGCLLTQPYRADTPLSGPDLRLMKAMADQAVEGTGYRVYQVHPDFAYDAKQVIVGVWADAVSTTFGVPGYTLELWDPFGAAGVQVDKPASFFLDPDDDLLVALLTHVAKTGEVEPWRSFSHPQLGDVEIGGIDYLHTIRNPPVDQLAAECDKGFRIAERLRRSLPRVTTEAHTADLGGATELRFRMCNEGYQATHGLLHAETIGACPGVSATLELGDGVTLARGPSVVALSQLQGWGSAHFVGAGHPVYPALPLRPQRAEATWVLRGSGTVTIRWEAGRAGAGVTTVAV